MKLIAGRSFCDKLISFWEARSSHFISKVCGVPWCQEQKRKGFLPSVSRGHMRKLDWRMVRRFDIEVILKR
jgi:hypothetical protein